MHKNDVPIIIPVKGKSVRCPNKNAILLPYVLSTLPTTLLQNTYVVTDDKTMEGIACYYGAQIFKENREEKDSDITAVKKAAEHIGSEWVVFWTVTTPFKSPLLYFSMIEEIDDNTDIIFTTRKVSDRSIYYVNNGDWLVSDVERKGVNCPERIMADGAAYAIRSNWLSGVNGNYGFWNRGKKKFVLNNTPFYVDVDTPDDLQRFQILKDII